MEKYTDARELKKGDCDALKRVHTTEEMMLEVLKCIEVDKSLGHDHASEDIVGR